MRTGKLIRYGIAAAALALLLIPSCSLWKRPPPTRQYYIINYTPNTVFPQTTQHPYPFALQVGRFEVQRIFNRQNIIYRYSPNRIQYYEIERWAVRPDYMIKDMIFKHLDAARLTNFVGIEFFEIKPDYRLEGTVESLEKFDAGDLFYAHLGMTFKMLKVADGQQVWDYSFDERRRVYSEEMVHTVAAMSGILQSHMNTIIGQLDSLFLSYQTGIPWMTEEGVIAGTPAPADSTGQGLDESGFEIIPEKRK